VNKCIESLEELKRLASDQAIDCYVILAGGLARSSKKITYMPSEDMFDIMNYIDKSEQEVKTDQLKYKTILIEAIEKKCLFTDD
jgi:hypothetical protein